MARTAELSQENCPLFLLPPELRNRIYDFALLSEPHLSVDGHHTALQLPPAISPKILHTCKRIEREAAPVFYGRVTFWYQGTLSFLKWLHAIGERRRKLLIRVRCSQNFRDANAAHWYLRALYFTMAEQKLKPAGEGRLRVAVKLSGLCRDGKRLAMFTTSPEKDAALFARLDRDMLRRKIAMYKEQKRR
ncbi:hypothetical protein D0862_03716 [Hortaea werneckii]|uniref:F-box domain-containing protein n=1 Tax=Hortaea werneckii TaxID=91943 RepID=A0A3M7H8F0_HORWE|nr:hypothetical protein D0862_03716 [Hortaea werneckii]